MKIEVINECEFSEIQKSRNARIGQNSVRRYLAPCPYFIPKILRSHLLSIVLFHSPNSIAPHTVTPTKDKSPSLKRGEKLFGRCLWAFGTYSSASYSHQGYS